jgi:hypothetical protein
MLADIKLLALSTLLIGFYRELLIVPFTRVMSNYWLEQGE